MQSRVASSLLALVILIAPALLGIGAGAPVAFAATAPADLSVALTSVSPTLLPSSTADADPIIELTGTVTNRNGYRWSDAQAYLVMSPTPFTDREALSTAIGRGNGYTGVRIVSPLDRIDELGDIAPRATVGFRLRVRASQIGLSSAAGVFPVGVQVLATAPDGQRSNEAVGRATTTISRAAKDSPQVPAGLVWTFTMPLRQSATGRWTEPQSLVEAVRNGALRHRLDLAAGLAPEAATIIVDPALIDGLDDLIAGRRLPDGVALSDADVTDLVAFRDELLLFSRSACLWYTGYGRPDFTAIAASGDDHQPLLDAIDDASSQVALDSDLPGRRADLPDSRVATPELELLRRHSTSPVVVPQAALPTWKQSDGSVVDHRLRAGQQTLLVDAGLELPGAENPAVLRQRLLADITFAGLSRAADRSSRADAVVFVAPNWDPGASVDPTQLDAVLSQRQVTPTCADTLLAQDRTRVGGTTRSSAADQPIRTRQVEIVSQALQAIDIFGDVVPDDADLRRRWATVTTYGVSSAWRARPRTGLARADDLLTTARRQLDRLSITGPPSFVMSSSRGSFPVTISNDSDQAIAIDVRLDSSNPALKIPTVRGIEVGPGERRTVNIEVDAGTENSSTLQAQLVSPAGQSIGQPAVFNIRSTQVATTVWIAMGVAAVVMVAAVARRLWRRTHGEAEAPNPYLNDPAFDRPIRPEDHPGPDGPHDVNDPRQDPR